ncbi:putative Ubiquitin-conjugating enzyme 6 B (Ubc6B) [Monocercomonoides exilis]|uniref:putative Ubiquitin-conjugating enzyme 6 B (Ubc6B) n=1 Tax=Monocercomonoides exilis TaxID=2049356 RepID=UPI00355ABE1B|nr:putative Ubiquitin-conjugating enzyme 6 B (Ubc6B) [Monocercomonoides exilis]|eukprot:MONOS_6234.1-p1 / transcript=MONOS_6234.1 / gene=MONOS_6234 / organism=Monocercomonoides_exilis_PA203 / gene_product=Ubiquitin-conjugating enzyme 6 B (Ubc6B) / transcript_product=Ubiquitin-conjugating enzyme 6 B (Ubc6B) / location=Mono_scaffold00193:87264-88450(+) / protein_length=335 / sequence_SO=supercontig / SO=protein_coding / is_pseudo=false
MAMYNAKNPSIKRIMQEIKQLTKICGPDKEFYAKPLDDDIFEIHFTIRGPPDSPYSEGLYHGRLRLPSEYPYKPPELMFLTPSGRFSTHTKVCLTVTSFHPEEWRASWDIRTILIAIASFFTENAAGGVGALNYSEQECKKLAFGSKNFKCSICGMDHSTFLSNSEYRKLNVENSAKTESEKQSESQTEKEQKIESCSISFHEEPINSKGEEIKDDEAIQQIADEKKLNQEDEEEEKERKDSVLTQRHIQSSSDSSSFNSSSSSASSSSLSSSIHPASSKSSHQTGQDSKGKKIHKEKRTQLSLWNRFNEYPLHLRIVSILLVFWIIIWILRRL